MEDHRGKTQPAGIPATFLPEQSKHLDCSVTWRVNLHGDTPSSAKIVWMLRNNFESTAPTIKEIYK